MTKSVNSRSRIKWMGFLMTACLGYLSLNSLISPAEASSMEGFPIGTFDGSTTFTLSSDTGILPTLALGVKNQNGSVDYYESAKGSLTISGTQEGATLERAILKGQTLANMFKFKETNTATLNTTYIYSNNKYTVTSDGVNDGYVKTDITVYLEANKTYTFKAKCDKGFNNDNGYIYLLLNNSASNGKKMANENTTFTVPTSGIYYVRLDVRASSEPYIFSDLMILEGDYTNVDIPYFEGSQSVQLPTLTTTGKNLFDKNNVSSIEGFIHNTLVINATSNFKTYYIKCEPNTTYTMSKMISKYFKLCESSEIPTVGGTVSNLINNPTKTSLSITTSSTAKYLCFNVHGIGQDTIPENEILDTVQIEKGTMATPYKPYQSNVLSSPDDIVLRSNGVVYDELDLLTGKLTQRLADDLSVLPKEKVRFVKLHSTQSFLPIQGQEIAVTGSVLPTIASVTVPTNALTFKLDPNQEAGQQFIAPDFSITNAGLIPLNLSIQSFEQNSNVLRDVLPDAHDNWADLGRKDSLDIALALVPKPSEGWANLSEGPRYVADDSNYELGIMKGNSSVTFAFEALHGRRFTHHLYPQYRLNFLFEFVS